jgi:hypothetical protein
LIIAWPVLWVLSAFAFRGGVVIRIMELSLVRQDGRRAGTLRCARLALLILAPPAALLAGAALLDGWHWSEAAGGAGGVWASWLAELPRWACLALLLVYAVLTIRSPERTFCDRLAGTYLVPK